jgi:hypothetical protein
MRWSKRLALAADSCRQRIHVTGVTNPPEKGKPRENLRFFAAPPPQSVWKRKAITFT